MRRMRTRVIAAGLPIVAAATLAQAAPALAATAGGPPTKASVSASMIMFSVRTLTVAPGAKVTFSNREDPFYATPHTFTSDKSGLFSTGNVAAGKSRTVTAPKSVGTYKFHCNVHSSMKGTLIVKR